MHQKAVFTLENEKHKDYLDYQVSARTESAYFFANDYQHTARSQLIQVQKMVSSSWMNISIKHIKNQVKTVPKKSINMHPTSLSAKSKHLRQRVRDDASAILAIILRNQNQQVDIHKKNTKHLPKTSFFENQDWNNHLKWVGCFIFIHFFFVSSEILFFFWFGKGKGWRQLWWNVLAVFKSTSQGNIYLLNLGPLISWYSMKHSKHTPYHGNAICRFLSNTPGK